MATEECPLLRFRRHHYLMCLSLLTNVQLAQSQSLYTFKTVGSGPSRTCRPPDTTETSKFTVTRETDCCRSCGEELWCQSLAFSSVDGLCLLYNQTWDQDKCATTAGWHTLNLESPSCENNGTRTAAGGCQCSGGYVGDRCERLMEDCYEAKNSGHYPDLGSAGYRYLLAKPLLSPSPLLVRCIRSGATYIQRRALSTDSINFTRGWSDYVDGFGDVETNFWMGLQNIYYFTNSRSYDLVLAFTDYSNNPYRVDYLQFVITEDVTYTASLGSLVGSPSAGDILQGMNGQRFSTYDADNDNSIGRNCAAEYAGGWWFNDCADVNMNGKMVTTAARAGTDDEIFWDSLGLTSALRVSCKITRTV